MNDKGQKGLYTKKWYTNKKKSKSYTHKKNESNEIVHQSLNPHELYHCLPIYDFYVNFNIPYYGWKLFFDEEEYESNSETVAKIRAVESFITRYPRFSTLLTLENLESGLVFAMDICELHGDQIFLDEWTDFKKDIYENPVHTLNCFKLAIHQTILSTVPQGNLSSASIVNLFPTVRLSILNYKPVISLQDLRASFYGKLVSIKGCVIRVGHVNHVAQWVAFTCNKCNLQKIMKQPQGIYTVPKKCNVCGVSKFRAILDSPLVKSVGFQIIKIQELSSEDQNNKGTMPRTVDVELMDDLVNTCMPGDDITVTGIVKGTNNAKGRNKVLFSLCMEAITIVNNKQGFQNKISVNCEMSVMDYLAIKEVYQSANIFSLLVRSLCPSIYGHEIVKAGLILSLFGGNAEQSELRENVHILIVGDPGLGKSQMLQACARVAIKGVYVCGNSSTSSGLTITLAKESKSNNFTLEPGALVLADKGCCCIDEFDKMGKQHAVLLEAMEQQCVSVAKSGVICSLPTRTSILAAANPINGRFNKSKTIMQNLKMSAPLLSRFDLVFLLLDEPDKRVDDLLCKHVMGAHANANTRKDIESRTFKRADVPSLAKLSLRDKLSSSETEHVNVIPQPILRKYIAYARQYVKPTLTKEAAIMLQDYYLKLRDKYNKFADLSVCSRQLEAMIRLTEARAKLELRTEAVEADALDIIEILQHTFDSKIVNPEDTNKKNATGGKVRRFITMLRQQAVSNNSKIFSMKKLQEIALDINILVDQVPDFIAKLNENGILLKEESNTYRFVSH